MSQKPSLGRQIFPAVALTVVGVGFISQLDNPGGDVVALEGVKKQIMEFDPTKSLESRILKTRKDVTKTMKLSESDLNRIVKNIIGEMEK